LTPNKFTVDDKTYRFTDPRTLMASHTCFNRIDFPYRYQTRAHMEEKLDELIANCDVMVARE